jgi:hypothetical protein
LEEKFMGEDLDIVSGAPVPFTYTLPAPPEDAIVGDVKDANGIIQTNALDINIQDPKWNATVELIYRAVFLNSSRINHR